MTTEPHDSVEVFFSYAHEDEALRDELKKHLSNLKRQGVITDWYDRDISAGKEWDEEVKEHLESARVILLLISPDFMDSDYINDVEVKRAMERHESGEARVLPVILRPVDWQGAPFSKLQGLPTDVKPVSSWDDRDEAFLDITKGIRKAIQELSGSSARVPTVPDIPRPPKVGFVSRRDKDGRDIVESLVVELAPEKNQLVALWGAGGVGKTTLAAEAVRALAEAYGQRIIWVTADARPNFAFSTFLDDIADQLGRTDLRPLAVGPKEEALRPLIGAKPTLIVLDNLETIAPGEELQCKEFLAKRVRCPALITTRERIGDSHLIPLAAMAPDEAKEFLRRLILQSPHTEVYDVVDSQRILQTAEWNPLIIRWIVAQIDLAEDPDEVLTDLARGEGDAAERVFDRSFNLRQMADGGRAVLLALSLFVPSASRPMLSEVAGLGTDRKRFKKAQQILASLWMVKQTDGGHRLAVEGLTRELARMCLSRDPRSRPFRKRYVNRFLRYVQVHTNQTGTDFDSLNDERENIFNAMDIALSTSQYREMERIRIGIENFLRAFGFWDEAIRYGQQAIAAAKASKDDRNIAAMAGNVGVFHWLRGEHDKARSIHEEVLEIFSKSGNRKNVALALIALGQHAQTQGDLVEARRQYSEAMGTLEDAEVGGMALHQLGRVCYREGDFEKADELLGESLILGRKSGVKNLIIQCLKSQGDVKVGQNEFTEAHSRYDEALRGAEALHDRLLIANIKRALGLLAEKENERSLAIELLREAFTIYEELRFHLTEDVYRDLERVECRS
jgi:tetratricopeptide (TPR) repeat protein